MEVVEEGEEVEERVWEEHHWEADNEEEKVYDENLKDKGKMMEDNKYREEQGILLTKENTDTELQTRSLLHLKIQNSFQFLNE